MKVVLVENEFLNWFLFRWHSYGKLELVYFHLNQSRKSMDTEERNVMSGLVEMEINQVKFSITMSPEQEPVQEFFLNKYDQ